MPQSQKALLIEEALRTVWREVDSQDAKWGEQNHGDDTAPGAMPLVALKIGTIGGGFARADALAASAKVACDLLASMDVVTWRDILLEEVFEAFAEEEGSDALRTELIQVAAVAVQWVLSMDRRAARATEGAGTA